ncbi:MAG TPA: DUF6438 domain-containing protein [Polyangiaceae bacterium]
MMRRIVLVLSLLAAAAACRTVGDPPSQATTPTTTATGTTIPTAALSAKLAPTNPTGCPAAHQPATARLILQRSMCYGYCPDYTIEVHGDGQAIFEGRNFVRVRGRHTGRIPQADTDALFAKAACAHPETWKTEYTWPVTDNPTAIVTVDLAGDGSPPVVVNDYPPCHETHDGNETPEALCDLERAIDTTAGTAAWVNCVGADGGETYCTR